MSQSQYFGSSSIQTSTLGQELVNLQSPNSAFGKFSFMNDQPCSVSINNSDFLFLRALQGFDCEKRDYSINSFIIKESGITYNWIGMLR